MTTKDDGKPMDASIKEVATGSAHVNNTRNAYALVQLMDEVRQLFPETPYEFGGYDGRNTALEVSFDLSAEDSDEAGALITLLGMIKSDPRVLEVISEDKTVLVALRPSARTQDIRDPFGLIEAYCILTEETF